MGEVLFFMLGALFTLMLVMALLLLLAGVAQPVAAGVMDPPQDSRAHAGRTASPQAAAQRRTGAKPAANSAQARLSGSAAPSSPADREAYRILAALDQAERALRRISESAEAPAAKIAAQTLRRMSDATEPPTARLSFARARLELLSLRPEPKARAEARATLAFMA